MFNIIKKIRDNKRAKAEAEARAIAEARARAEARAEAEYLESVAFDCWQAGMKADDMQKMIFGEN